MGRYSMGAPGFFGLDDFGMPVGLKPGWGVLIGGVASTGVAIASRMSGNATAAKYSEAIGAGAGIFAGGIMAIFQGSRAAGWSAIITSAATAGLRALENLLFSQPTNGVVIDRTVSLQGARGGLGLTTMEQVPTLQGAQAGVSAPPQLLGQAQNGFANNPAAQQLPQDIAINGLASRFGNTLFGGGNN